MADPNPTGIDAYKPSEIYALVDQAGAQKARIRMPQLLALSLLAGVFIALGAAAYTMVMTGTDMSFGPARFLGGIVFSLGLILVIVAGAELFTGNALLVIAVVEKLVSPGQLLRNWSIVYIGNFAGAILIAGLVWASGLLNAGLGETAIGIAESKAALGMTEAFARAILCNILVCLAVWLSLAARSAAGKILTIVWPIASFVLLGLEHSIANMYFFPQAMLAGAAVDWTDFGQNLFIVTLGNVAGGAGGVAFAYRLAYGNSESHLDIVNDQKII
ncbi:formate/nitrite transporter family protein [Parasphingorhabdus sp.]|uniref:formate/nitrite transporter family protein n=2 Tax=Parasphingorhabdus sp. TaxID=2709688 RepID=UPI003A934C7F